MPSNRFGLFLLCAILLAPSLCAQTSSSSSSTREEEQPRFLKRFSVGVRATILTLDMFPNSTNTTFPNSQTQLEQDLSPITQRLGGGVTLEYQATRRILVSGDLLYQYLGFEANTTTTVTLADGTSQITSVVESTHARCWDVPILARYGTLPARTASASVLIGGGAMVRRISGVRTSVVTENPDNSLIYSYAPHTPQNTMSYGVVAAGGVRLKDDFGIKVTPEVRYIRWLSDLYTSWPGKLRRNELEVVIGLTF